MTLEQAMMSLDASLPMWVQVIGDTIARCAIGFCVIVIVCKVLVVVL